MAVNDIYYSVLQNVCLLLLLKKVSSILNGCPYKAKPCADHLPSRVVRHVCAHQLDVRFSTKEDPKWLIEQRETEIKLIEG
ncbi:hypothetical protein ACFX13_028186 [Malus domestica]